MNKQRRARIAEAIAKMEEAKSIVEECWDEESDYFDNMPESLKQGDKGSMAEEAVSNLENSVSNLESAISDAEEAQG